MPPGMQGANDRRLLEREPELEQIDQQLRRARGGEGSLLLIEGGPGLGKSALLAAARSKAGASGMRTLAARASELEIDVPFVLAERLLAQMGASPAPHGDREESDLGTIRELERVLLEGVRSIAPRRDADPPIAILVDDIQWSDGASLRFLLHVALGLEGLPIAIFATHRPEAPVPDLIRALRGEAGASVLRPGPLSPAAVGALADSLLGDGVADEKIVAALASVTGGTPFYAVELLKEVRDLSVELSPAAIAGVVPDRVLNALLGRLARCGAEAAALATALAVLGDETPIRLVADLAALDPATAAAAADRLIAADILGRAPLMRFAHPLIGSALLADTGTFERARLHGRAAELLNAAGERDERVAVHYLHTDPASDPGVVATMRAAAASARADGEPETSARFLTRALAEPPPEEERSGVLGELAEVEATAGLEGAIEHFEASLAGIGSPRRRAEACVSLARTLHMQGEFAAAAETADRGLDEVTDDQALRERLLAVWLDAAILHAPLHPELTVRTAPLFAQLQEGVVPSDPALRVHLATALGNADAPADHVLSLLEGAFADPLIDGDLRGTALGFAANTLVYLDALELAEQVLDAAEAAAERRGGILALSIARHLRAHVHYHSGRLTDAVLDGEHALEIHRLGWTDWAWSRPILTISELERGDIERAAALSAVADIPTADEPNQALVLEARARLRLAQHDAEGALADARAAGEISEGRYGVRSSRQFEWVRLAALAAGAANQDEAAREYASESLTRARAGAVPRQLGVALMTAGLLTGGKEGIGLLEQAREALAESPSRMAVAHVELELGSALRRAGRRERAKEPLMRALELSSRFEAAPLIRRARGELAALGLRPRRGERTGLGALTPGERRVFDLAADGLSTPEIAHALVVSRRTVENHLYRIYRKLEVTSRRELAAFTPT